MRALQVGARHIMKGAEMRDNDSGGVGITSVLTIVFIVLKVVGVIDWSWIWVLSPLWINIILTLIIIVVLHINGDWWFK